MKTQLACIGILFALFVFCVHRSAQSTAPPFVDRTVVLKDGQIPPSHGDPVPAEALKPLFHVVIATRDLPVGHLIQTGDVREVPSARVLDGSFLRSRQVAGRAVVLAIPNGANIQPRDVSR